MAAIGFTGTREGMTADQLATLHMVLSRAGNNTEFHHGDCMGADSQAHSVADVAELQIVVHPPEDNKLRAYCNGDVIETPLPYHERNRNIVDRTSRLIATPKDKVETGGTWYTINYARDKNKPVMIIWPDGTFTVEIPA